MSRDIAVIEDDLRRNHAELTRREGILIGNMEWLGAWEAHPDLMAKEHALRMEHRFAIWDLLRSQGKRHPSDNRP